MFKRAAIGLIVAGLLIGIGSIAALGQTVITSGRVELEKQDGSRVPVAGATIDVFRTDIKGSASGTKTDKKGSFTFANLLIGGVYTLVFSAPDCEPTLIQNIKAGSEKIVVTMHPGDGRRWTADEVEKALSGAGSSVGSTTKGNAESTTPAEKSKEQIEYEKKVAEIEADNKRKQKAYDIVAASMKAGNDAFTAGANQVKAKDLSGAVTNFTTAIAKYDEGVQAEPNFVGLTTPLLNNRATALRQRAVATYNLGTKETDAASKTSMYDRAKSDLLESAKSYERAWQVIQSAKPEEIAAVKDFDTLKSDTIRGSRDTFAMAVATERIDPAIIEIAKAMIPEYLKVEPDAAKKIEAQLIIADMYRINQNREEAIGAYKAVLEAAPDNVDALAGAGLMLVDLAWLKDNDKALAQEGANYLQRFVAIAPDSNKMKEGAKGYLEILKQQSIVPVKTATPSKKKH
ncbi:MAG: carboxypeptidase regulatory-like domain-containing protein [Chloracidobacterium sp.]|nr:carboxypeptidase regulatory-like domain-containing protein [Chloracidobacterium sp.]MCC6825304.1 carboxypeptidase regulatory-like domain-containing protein [Acidobacteriota bacterium]MCO5332575.1 carboxypeptidase regulatory-like domain-containing protein [Pyrinomonadaceae bacterium]